MLSSNKEKIKVIGLGALAGIVVDELRQYPEYRVYKILDDAPQNNSFSLGSFNTMKEYEENLPATDLELYLESITQDQTVLLVLEGGNPITGAALRLLEIIKHANLSVLFIQPSTSLKSDAAAINARLAFGALQQYARSGLLERMFFVQKSRIESMVGDVPINLYEKRVAEILSYTIAMLYYFENSDAVISTPSTRPLGCRLATLGLSSLSSEKPEVQLLFPVEDPRTVEFYYGIPQQEIDTNVELMTQIKNHIDTNFNFSQSETSFCYKVVPVLDELPYLLGVFYALEPQEF